MKQTKEKQGELAVGEPHPAAYKAKRYIASVPLRELFQWQEAFASSALAGNRLAEICSETLDRLTSGQPVSDRYLLGLAWTIKEAEEKKWKAKRKKS